MKTIFSLILSIVILFTSMGFTISSHICGGEKVKTVLSLGTSDVSCGMEKSENNCATGDQMKSNCCQDEFQKIQINENCTQQLAKVNLSTNFLFTFIACYFDLVPNLTSKIFFFKDYSPPPLIRDIPVMVQSFLI